MATVVLSTVGGLVAGPVGAAIGAVAGYAIDSRVLGPRAPTGPRLGDRAVQTSTYGSAIPRIFGRLRVAGTVIWATDIREDRHKASGGKGGAKGTAYSYSISFAVALSGRPIRGVGRIWADGKLLRGRAGDWKSDLAAFHLHLGDGRDGVDPLIASIEGVDATPAYDDLAYVVFDTLQLADFGNRIPSLSFEVEADVGAVTAGAIADALSGGEVGGTTVLALDGYAASGTSVRGALAELVEVAGLAVRDDGDRLILADPDGPATSLDQRWLGVGDPDGAAVRIVRAGARTVPDLVELSYYDPALDWQTGLQRARGDRPPIAGQRDELAAGLTTAAAKGLAEGRLATLDAGRTTATARLGWRAMAIRPGDAVTLPGRSELWTVAGLTLDANAVELALRARPSATVPGEGASPGRPVPSPDLPIGPTTLRLLDLPALGDEALSRPRLLVAMAGSDPGWRGADLLVSPDDGGSWQSLERSAATAVIGTATTTLAAGSPLVFDGDATVEIELLADDMWLADADDAALVAGANLAMLGGELIQFGRAAPLGARRFRLDRLLRGRRGTEAATGEHHAGEDFVLLDPATLIVWDPPLATFGARVRVAASGRGDAVPAEAAAVVVGRAVRPPVPVHLTAATDQAGETRISWIRRSRAGWLWANGGDIPLGEESERYRVDVTVGDRVVRSAVVTGAEFTYTAAERAIDGIAGGFTIALVQLGTIAPSEAVFLAIDPRGDFP